MPYLAEISRSNPTAILFLVDLSGSMQNLVGGQEISRAQFLADALNRVVANLIARSSKAEGIRDYFDVGVISYSGRGVKNPLEGPFASKVFNPISLFESNPIVVEDRVRKIPDGAGGVIDQKIKFPVWFKPDSYGKTPMRKGIVAAAQEVAQWCDAHPNSYPPTVLHVTDGEASDGDPESLAEQLCQLSTNDGQTLLFNLRISNKSQTSLKFPNDEDKVGDKTGMSLYRMSSVLPDCVALAAKEKGYAVEPGARGFFYNVEPIEIVDFFEIGTRAFSPSLMLK